MNPHLPGEGCWILLELLPRPSSTVLRLSASSWSQWAAPDLNRQKECQKICQTECQKGMLNRMSWWGSLEDKLFHVFHVFSISISVWLSWEASSEKEADAGGKGFRKSFVSRWRTRVCSRCVQVFFVNFTIGWAILRGWFMNIYDIIIYNIFCRCLKQVQLFDDDLNWDPQGIQWYSIWYWYFQEALQLCEITIMANHCGVTWKTELLWLMYSYAFFSLNLFAKGPVVLVLVSCCSTCTYGFGSICYNRMVYR